MIWLKEVVWGFSFGLANIIPGVSGGTMALVLGFYERFIGFINRLNVAEVLTLFRLKWGWVKSGFRREGWRPFWAHLVERDWPFILRLGLGALLCIFFLSSLMKFLLEHHFEYTYAFFFGLILLSVGVPWRLIVRKSLGVWLALVVGLVLTVGMSMAVNPADKAQSKSEVYKARVVGVEQVDVLGDGDMDRRFAYVGKYTPGELGAISLAGMLAVSAMVLPGISGSLLLILLGQYIAVVTAIANVKKLQLDELAFLGLFAVGMVVGILVTARLVDYFLRRCHDGMMGFLTGLIVGSLYALWPFKYVETLDLYMKEGGVVGFVEQVRVYTNRNVWPEDMGFSLPALGLMLLGGVCMFFCLRVESVNEKVV